MSQSQLHNHMTYEKNIEDSKRMILYNISIVY